MRGNLNSSWKQPLPVSMTTNQQQLATCTAWQHPLHQVHVLDQVHHSSAEHQPPVRWIWLSIMAIQEVLELELLLCGASNQHCLAVQDP
jgi:hypothetical protein